jgi:hypothetical protein
LTAWNPAGQFDVTLTFSSDVSIVWKCD